MRTARSLRSRVAGVFSALVIALATGPVTTPAQASPVKASTVTPLACVLAFDNPHFSAGAGGVIAKLRYCEDFSSRVEVSLYLYLCPNPPSDNEDNWFNEGCVVKASTHYGWNATAFTNYTRYVPPSGQPGAHGAGWWVACAIFTDPESFMLPSSAAYIEA